MKLPKLRKSKRQGFTLIELLTVIAIIGILAGLLSAIVPLVKTKAAQMSASNNCRNLALGYASYSGSGTTPKNIPIDKAPSVTQWALFLSQKTDINDGRLWFIPEDDRLASVEIPKQIMNLATKTIDSQFSAALPKSWAVVAGAPRNAEPTYPLIWTRGLTGTGWSLTSPWKGKGGHIGFITGNVGWYDSAKDENDVGIFIDYNSKQPTENVTAAVGTNSKVLEDQ